MTVKWPDEVPILSAKDFCRGSIQDGCRRCLIGWLHEVFRNGSCDLRILSQPAAIAVARRAIKATAGKWAGIASFNDNPKVRLATLARVWNQAMADMGYVVGNPEAQCE